MPVSFGIREGKFFQKYLFSFDIGYHFVSSDIIVLNSRCFSVTLHTKILQLHNECGLMCLSAF